MRALSSRLVRVLCVALLLLGLTGVADARRESTVRCVPTKSQLRFRAADGTRLVGYRLGTGKTAVVLAHQRGGDSCQWSSYAKRLASLGYMAIAVDFRGSGNSQTRTGPASLRRAADLVAAAKVARRLGAQEVFLAGASMGGTIAVGAAGSIRPPVAGVVAVSSPSSWPGVDAIAVAKRLQVPALYLAGDRDLGFVDETRALYDATASSDKALEILPSGEHGVALVRTSVRARAVLEEFLRSH